MKFQKRAVAWLNMLRPGTMDDIPSSVPHNDTGTMTVYFISDTHFGDARILRTAKRPFKTIEVHDATLIERWQETVRPQDEVWHLGDFAPGYASKRVGALLELLPGRKHLITGNNDDQATRTHEAWESVGPYVEMTIDDVTCVLCHYAFRTWYRMGKGSVDLHGHSHGKLKPLTRQFDVGVDLWDYRPVTLETMLASRRRKSKDAAKASARMDKAA